MFRIVCDPSSGNTELCLTEITLSGSQIFFVCLVGAWQRNFELAVCVHVPCTHTHTHTHTHTFTNRAKFKLNQNPFNSYTFDKENNGFAHATQRPSKKLKSESKGF
jgi:hypothetical protein